MSDESLKRMALKYHRQPVPGKLEIAATKPLGNQRDLALAYSPGVAAACEAIVEDSEEAATLTGRQNLVAVISNGTAVLGLGNIGPLASKPVMEGKAVLFKKFAGIDVFDIELDEMDPDKLVDIISALEPTFGAINLEDIKAPECFVVERKCRQRMSIPVFHDDQHGTAVVTTAALINALKLVRKKPKDIKVVVSGAGAAGTACSKMIMHLGVKNLIGCDSKGAIHNQRTDINQSKRWFADNANPDQEQGSLKEVLKGADVFVGVSAPNILDAGDIRNMEKDAIVFAMANPDPEILPEDARPVAAVVATGRSDYPNQINNVLCFPGIFRGALDCRAKTITEEMKLAASHAIAETLDEQHLNPDYIIPTVFDKSVTPKIAAAIAECHANET